MVTKKVRPPSISRGGLGFSDFNQMANALRQYASAPLFAFHHTRDEVVRNMSPETSDAIAMELGNPSGFSSDQSLHFIENVLRDVGPSLQNKGQWFREFGRNPMAGAFYDTTLLLVKPFAGSNFHWLEIKASRDPENRAEQTLANLLRTKRGVGKIDFILETELVDGQGYTDVELICKQLAGLIHFAPHTPGKMVNSMKQTGQPDKLKIQTDRGLDIQVTLSPGPIGIPTSWTPEKVKQFGFPEWVGQADYSWSTPYLGREWLGDLENAAVLREKVSRDPDDPFEDSTRDPLASVSLTLEPVRSAELKSVVGMRWFTPEERKQVLRFSGKIYDTLRALV